MSGGAPGKNLNAAKSGLYSKNPRLKVAVAASSGPIELAEFSAALRDAAQWIAEQLAEQLDPGHPDARLIALYAAVSSEMAQMVGELLGESGIKAAPLGTLGDVEYEALMRAHARSLALILSQCLSAYQALQNHEELNGDRGVVINGRDGEVANPVLGSLAANIRAAKRIMRDMAADRAWQIHGVEMGGDLGVRLMASLNEGRDK